MPIVADRYELVVAIDDVRSQPRVVGPAYRSRVRTVEVSIESRKSLSGKEIQAKSAWRPCCHDDVTAATCRAEAVRMATRIRALDTKLRNNRKALDALVSVAMPELTALSDIGAVGVAAVLVPPVARTGRSRVRCARRNVPDPGIISKHVQPQSEPRW